MKKERIFGTDGVRGIPGQYPLLPGMISGMAYLAARLLMRKGRVHVNGTAPAVLMARDTRGSGPRLCRDLVKGFSAAGARTIDLGVAPTPAVAYLTPRLGALCGVVVSASHNPAQFNGIKFFTSDGYKMTPELEDLIEKELPAVCAAGLPSLPAARGRLFREDGSRRLSDYVDFLRSTFPAMTDLGGMKLVVDCAHGAASRIAPALLESLGAKVVAIGCRPDGRNINERRGALHPAEMSRIVVQEGADAGICLDGDADRCLFSDEKGRLLDGDALICLSAMHLLERGLLRSNKVVLTVMSNLGLIRFLRTHGVSVVSVPVGDRNVTEAIDKESLSLGGENSGHIIFRSFASTGDGLLTALQTLAALKASGKPLSWHRRSYHATPQIINNLKLKTARKTPLQDLPRLTSLIGRCEKRLGEEGRVFVRYSGTEPLLRIMLEGPKAPLIRRMARDLARTYLAETAEAHH
jgi:phosphoglucosamine mutase